jgi:O-antigen/teichoic acid export membrane protein
MFNKLKPKSEFSRNVLTLMTGTTIAQAIPIAISPILTRIYTPEDFGVFALFVAITSIFGSVASGRYELAIMLPKKDEDAINIFALGFIIIIFISLLLLFVILLFNDYLIKLLDNKEIGIWLYFVPITVFFIGFFNILNYFNNRKKQYKDIAVATIIKSIVLAVIQLSVGFFKQGASGLIGGQIISNIFANMRLIKNIIKDKALIARISKVKIIALGKRYKNFPLISLPSNFINVLNQNLVNMLISTVYNIKTLGFYALIQKVLGVPSSLIGSAIGQVFFQQASKERQESGLAIKTFTSTVIKLVIIAIPMYGILFLIVEDLFLFVFGETWQIAGEYAKILVPLFFIRFISSTVSAINTVFEKQLYGLYISLILLVTSLAVIFLSFHYNIDTKSFFSYLSFCLSVDYFLFLLFYYFISKGEF